jgi:hypothetical protein
MTGHLETRAESLALSTPGFMGLDSGEQDLKFEIMLQLQLRKAAEISKAMRKTRTNEKKKNPPEFAPGNGLELSPKRVTAHMCKACSE